MKLYKIYVYCVRIKKEIQFNDFRFWMDIDSILKVFSCFCILRVFLFFYYRGDYFFDFRRISFEFFFRVLLFVYVFYLIQFFFEFDINGIVLDESILSMYTEVFWDLFFLVSVMFVRFIRVVGCSCSVFIYLFLQFVIFCIVQYFLFI